MWNNPISAVREAVDQALRVRGSRDFADRRVYEAFLQNLVAKRNQSRATRFATEKEVLHPLPAAKLALCKEVRVTVSRFSTVQVLGNTYSVPSRLIGTGVLVRVRAETLEGYVGTMRTFTLPRPAWANSSIASIITISSGRWHVSLARLPPTATAMSSSQPRSSGKRTTLW